MAKDRIKPAGKFKLRRVYLIIAVVALCIAGVLVYRLSRTAGMAVTLFAISAYLMVDVGKTVKRAKGFKRINAHEKLRLVMWCALFYVVLKAWISGTVPYVFLLTILAVDYVLSGSEKQADEKH